MTRNRELRQVTAAWVAMLIAVATPGLCGTLKLAVDDPEGRLGRAAAPVAATLVLPEGLEPLELVDAASGAAVPAQFLPNAKPGPGKRPQGELVWLVPPGPKGRRLFLARRSAGQPIAAGGLQTTVADDRSHVDVTDGQTLVLRFHFGTAPLPKGVPARYACGGYIHPLCGPDGETLTEAHPRDHPHHRGVMWAWPVCRWRGKVTDPWAVAGCWVRPEKLRVAAGGPVVAHIGASSVWKWADRDAIVREDVAIRVYRLEHRARVVDIEVTLEGLAADVRIGGRPGGGYGGFGLRMAPRKAQQIALLTDPPDAKPRRSWLEYSDTFAGATGRTGVAIFEHATNPLYPNALKQYPNLNYVMPAFPGPREVALEKGKPVVLRYRLWVHPGHAQPDALTDQWAAYAATPQATVARAGAK